ncbi:MAG: sensor histidine kinase [Bacteroidetes bacterium]|nr:sensor histidine kinase [Bacteroidota bacterium]
MWLFISTITILLLSGLLPIWHATILTFCNVLLLVFVYYANIYFVYQYFEQKKYLLYILFLLLLLIVVAVTRLYFNGYYMQVLLQLKIPIDKRWTYLFSTLTTFVVLAISFFSGLLVNRSKKEKEHLMLIMHQRETQLQFLKAQMSPHFLFNTLNNIYSLSLSKSTKTPEMILLLSDLLRYAVYESRHHKVSVSSEVDQIKKLIHMYQLSSEVPLHVSFEEINTSQPAWIEPMILIPLVENCFKHSNIQTSPDASIQLRLAVHGQRFEFSTFNTVDPLQKNNGASSGVGLANIKERLQLQYAGKYSLETQSDTACFQLKLTIQLSEWRP